MPVVVVTDPSQTHASGYFFVEIFSNWSFGKLNKTLLLLFLLRGGVAILVGR